MRKFNFLLGAVSGLFGGMVFTNKNLREKLKKADDPKKAARILGEEMSKSGKELAKEARDWAKSEEVQSWWKRMRKNAWKKEKALEKRAKKFAGETVESAKDAAGKAFNKAKKSVTKTK